MEKWLLTGNVGREPEMRYLPDGTAVTNFSLAVSNKWTDRATGQTREHTTWYQCAAWNRTAEIVAQYVHKGDRLLIEGKPNTDDRGYPRIWFGTDGAPRTSYEVTVQRLEMFGKRDGNTNTSAANDEYVGNDTGTYDDEIPF